MQAAQDENGSPSLCPVTNSDSAQANPSVDGVSDATSPAAVSRDETASALDKEDNTDKPDSAKPATEVGQDNEPESFKNRDEKKEVDFQTDSDTDSDESSDHPRAMDMMVRRFAGRVNSRTIFKFYKTNLERNPTRRRGRNQSSNLVKSLVDYLTVLEDRVDRLEAGKEPKADESTIEPSESDASESNPERSESGDSTVEVTVRFFKSAAYLGKDGSFPSLITEPEKGTFMCSHDSQHLIRVLYSTLRDDGSVPQKQADSEPPKVGEIDILTLGVTSEALSTFFAKQLNIDTYDSPLVRFGRPFRPLIRNISHLRDQLKKLEDRYGQVWAEENTSKTSRDSSAKAPDDTEPCDEKDVLPFPNTSISDDDALQPFDRPAALSHFRAFLAFVDKYLGKQIQLYARLREGKESHIAFENLWMLFDVGDTIYCPLREAGIEEYTNSEGSDHVPIQRHTPQAYRVVATSRGMPLVHTMAPNSKPKEKNEALSSIAFGSPFKGSGAKTGVETIASILTQSVEITRKIRNSYSEFNVYCFYVDFDGVEYGTVREVFVFKPYEREMEIRALQAYPDRYLSHDPLHKRGRSFLDVTEISHLQYEGLTVGPNREEINSPVVVDVKLAFEGGPDTENALIQVPEFSSPASLWLSDSSNETYDMFGKSNCPHMWCYSSRCTSDVYIESQKKQRDIIHSEIKLVLEEYENEKNRGHEGRDRIKQLMEEKGIIRLLPGAVPGFALRNRKWVLLNLLQLGPVEQDSEWDNLVLPDGHRDMVQAMVETHTQGLSSNKAAKIGMDLVQGKGRGCIILLHGVPGVGKTSTAECVAAYTKKPLYPITCGDIGYKPEDVEKHMENHFRLAHKWGCVLLLDEADVFLAKRDQTDVQRNGLVSVFLRILEYYSGILFLTTNRVGAIDDAFRSRLHLTLYYPKLTRKQTKQIFKNNFGRIAVINANRSSNGLPPFEYEESEPKIMAWSKETWKTLGWNGRQIRNAFQTVLALAEFHDKKHRGESAPRVVTKKYFRVVANASSQFNEYLLATHRAGEDKLAGREFLRAQAYSPSPDLAFKGFNQDFSDSSSEEEDEDDRSETDSDSDEFDESDAAKKKRKKKSKEKKAKSSSSKKGKKTGGKKGKSEKKLKEKKKETKESDDSDDSD